MSIGLYELCTLATMGSFLMVLVALAQARAIGPAFGYATFCVGLGGAMVGAAWMPAFAQWFYSRGLEIAGGGFLLFVVAEVLMIAWGGARWQEMVGAGGLWLGFVASVCVGLRGEPGTARMMRQAAAVCVPVLVSAAVIAAGPQGLGATVLWVAHWAGLPAPVVVARGRR